MFVFWGLFPLLVLISLLVKGGSARAFQLNLIAMIWKIFAAFICAWLIINVWNFGDLPTYFTLSKEISSKCILSYHENFCESYPKIGIYVPSWVFALLFSFMPVSIYGLAVLSGTASFLFSYFLISAMRQHFVLSRLQIISIYFIPVTSIQAGYIGKETILLPLIGWFIYRLFRYSFTPFNLALLFFLLISVFLVRPYQAIFLALPTAAFILLSSFRKFKYCALLGILFLSVLSNSWVQIFKIIPWSTAQKLAEFGDPISFFEGVYHGGSNMLRPYPEPFHLLQNFRPFFWETNGMMSMVASLEYLLLLSFILVMSVKFWRKNRFSPHMFRSEQKRLIFIWTSCLLYSLVYGYSSNVNDLSRRHVYYYPFFILGFSLPNSQQRNNGIITHAQAEKI